MECRKIINNRLKDKENYSKKIVNFFKFKIFY